MQTFGRNMEFDWLRENIRIGVVSNRKVYKDLCFFCFMEMYEEN